MSQCRPMTIEVEDTSEDEAYSHPSAVFRCATFRPQTQHLAGAAGAGAGAYQLHLSELSSPSRVISF
jgi:hypothetical protein